MPKHEPGTAAHLANQIRKNNKTKIRWYCGLCHVACKDENGYKCHLEHETHIHREQAVQESLRSFKMSRDDVMFKRHFLKYLVSKHFGQTVLAHEVYRELYPIDRAQNIMKSTCWETLGVFVAQLRKEGAVEAAKGLKGWQVRITSQDFSDDDDEELSGGSGEKLTAVVKKDIEEISLKRVRLESIEQHTASTARMTDKKVAFTLGGSSSTRSFPKKKPQEESPFGRDDDSE